MTSCHNSHAVTLYVTILKKSKLILSFVATGRQLSEYQKTN